MRVLALDMGTSSVRAARFGANGRAEGRIAHVHYPASVSTEGGVTLDPKHLITATVSALDALKLGRKERIDAVAMSCFWHGLVGMRGGRACTPVFTWGDLRARDSAKALRERLDERAYHARTGCRLHASFWPAKLSWLSRTRVEGWLGAGELLAQVLFGSTRMSVSMASGTGLYDAPRGAWDRTTLKALHLAPARLPELSDAPLSGLVPRFARRWPSLARAPFFPAVGDGALANLGSGAVGKAHAGLTVGTSGALRVLVPVPRKRIPYELFSYRLDAERAVIGGALSTGGNLWPWLESVFSAVDERKVAAVAPDSHGLTVLPYLAGARAPSWDDFATSAVSGLTLATTPVQIARAYFEAMAFDFKRVFDALGVEDGPFQVHGSGGALEASKLLGPLLADVLGVPVTASAVGEASLRGAALYALERLGHPVRAQTKARRVFRPHPARTLIYARAMQRQDSLRF